MGVAPIVDTIFIQSLLKELLATMFLKLLQLVYISRNMNGELHWFKMKFDALCCFNEVVLIQFLNNNNAYRMQDTNVLVVNSKTGSEKLCGVLKVRSVWTIEGQTYRIACGLKCGDEIKLTVQQEKNNPVCIHMREITAIHTGLTCEILSSFYLN
jgi:hypothetical protein